MNKGGRETETEVRSLRQRQREVRCQEKQIRAGAKSNDRETAGIIMKKLGTDGLGQGRSEEKLFGFHRAESLTQG